MSDYIVKDTELTSVANAIRIKGGTNSQLVFPGGFVSAIGDISGGGGSNDLSTAEVTAGIGVAMDAPVVINEEDFQGIQMIGSPMEEETTWQIPLYKGKCMVSIYALDEGQTISASGNITEINEGVYLITGDCTITIS